MARMNATRSAVLRYHKLTRAQWTPGSVLSQLVNESFQVIVAMRARGWGQRLEMPCDHTPRRRVLERRQRCAHAGRDRLFNAPAMVAGIRGGADWRAKEISGEENRHTIELQGQRESPIAR